MRLAQVTAGVLVAVAALTGCSAKEPANDTLPTPSATAAEATPTLPPLGPPDFPVPAEARQMSPVGALAALEYYLELISLGGRHGGQPLRDLSVGCTFCSFLADRYDTDAHDGYTYSGGRITPADLNLPAINGTDAEFAFSASQSPVQILTTEGTPVPGRGQDAIFDLSAAAAMTWDDNKVAWLMTQLSFG